MCQRKIYVSTVHRVKFNHSSRSLASSRPNQNPFARTGHRMCRQNSYTANWVLLAGLRHVYKKFHHFSFASPLLSTWLRLTQSMVKPDWLQIQQTVLLSLGGYFWPSEVRFRGILALSRDWFYNGKKQKCKFLKKPSWPDFQILCADSWGNFIKNGTNLRHGEFFFGFDPFRWLWTSRGGAGFREAGLLYCFLQFSYLLPTPTINFTFFNSELTSREFVLGRIPLIDSARSLSLPSLSNQVHWSTIHYIIICFKLSYFIII